MSAQLTQIQTFHVFPRLPTEIQIMIWEFAAEIKDADFTAWLHLDGLRDAATEPLYKWISKDGIYNYMVTPNYFFGLVNQSSLYGYATRNTLMCTCRVSRLLALQAWKVDLEAIVIDGEDYETLYLRIEGDED